MLKNYLLSNKHKLRVELRQRRDSLNETLRKVASESICKQCCNYLSDYKSVGIYYPIHSEVDTLVLIRWLWDKGIPVSLPVIIGQDMEFRLWLAHEELITGRFSPEPAGCNSIIIPEVVITPLLGFDARGNRLGYGKGYYDKYFLKNPTVKTGLAFAVQEVAEIPVGEYDQRLNMVITEKKVFLYN